MNRPERNASTERPLRAATIRGQYSASWYSVIIVYNIAVEKANNYQLPLGKLKQLQPP